jgi:hypothetical protein
MLRTPLRSRPLIPPQISGVLRRDPIEHTMVACGFLKMNASTARSNCHPEEMTAENECLHVRGHALGLTIVWPMRPLSATPTTPAGFPTAISTTTCRCANRFSSRSSTHCAHLERNATPRSAVPNVSPCVLPVITIRMEPSLAQSEARRFYTPTHTRDVANLCPFLLQLPHDVLSFRLQAHTVTHRLTPHTVVSHSADERLVESNIGLPYINLSFI